MTGRPSGRYYIDKSALVSASQYTILNLILYSILLAKVYYFDSGSPAGTFGPFLVALVWLAPPFMVLQFLMDCRKFNVVRENEDGDNDGTE